MDVGDSLDTALEQAARALEPFADAFVIVARADSENGDKELFRYTGAGYRRLPVSRFMVLLSPSA